MPNQHPSIPSAETLRPILTSLIGHRFTIPMIVEDLSATHGITISAITVKRRLKELGLSIRCQLSLLEQRQLVLEEMSVSNGSKGVGLQTIQNRIYHKHPGPSRYLYKMNQSLIYRNSQKLTCIRCHMNCIEAMRISLHH